MVASPLSSQPSSVDTTAYIQAEARRIDDLIHRLKEDRAALSRRLNSVQAATRVLPPEILSLILKHASVPTPDPVLAMMSDYKLRLPPHLIFGSVSTSWREVVHSTPSLWNSILVKTGLKASRKWAVFLQASFKKSGSLPLTLAFGGLGKPWELHGCLISSEVDSVLMENSHRIRKLCLSRYISPKWASVIPNLVGLLDLHVSSTTSLPTLSFSRDLPLTRIRFNTSIQSLALPLPMSLTVISLSNLAIDLCFQLLTNSPRLVEFRCSEPLKSGRNHIDAALSGPLVLEQLEILEWTFLPDPIAPWSHELLTHIEVPALKTLKWVEKSGSLHLHNQATIASFLNRLPLSLRWLEFVDIDHVSLLNCNLIQHVRDKTEVRMITMEHCSESFICYVLVGLQRDEEGLVPFPSLNYIDIDEISTTFSPNEPNTLGHVTGACLAMVLRQRCNEIYDFTFAVNSIPIRWAESTIDDLQDLVDTEGLELELLHDGVNLLRPKEDSDASSNIASFET
ncbi:hypothetical protein AN958_02659 [Leucoagaricus sp. SymC.cos]|nr:hypothetical protein AN958_02659 [Leucoagaricus sp. SymC.cos]